MKRKSVTVKLTETFYDRLLKVCKEKGLTPEQYIEVMLLWHTRVGP